MFRRAFLSSLLAAMGLALPAVPAGTVPPACADAQAEFWQTWASEGERFTRPVALAARAVVDACPEDAPPAVTTLDPHRTLYGLLDDAKGALLGHAQATVRTGDRTTAALCGFTGRTTTEPASGLVTGWIMLVDGSGENGTDEGVGTATYDATTGYTEARVVGDVWGIHANNQGTGTLYFHGVPFPLSALKYDAVQAKAGCGIPPGPRLCWGDAYGWTTVANVATVSVWGRFYDCN